MTQEKARKKISRIIELQIPITRRIINDRSYKPAIGDEYQEARDELAKLREEVHDYINPPSHLVGGDPQRPNMENVERCKAELKERKKQEEQIKKQIEEQIKEDLVESD